MERPIPLKHVTLVRMENKIIGKQQEVLIGAEGLSEVFQGARTHGVSGIRKEVRDRIQMDGFPREFGQKGGCWRLDQNDLAVKRTEPMKSLQSLVSELQISFVLYRNESVASICLQWQTTVRINESPPLRMLHVFKITL